MKRTIKTILAIAGLLILSFLFYTLIPSYPGTKEFYKLISESDRIIVKELKVENETLVWKEIFESDDPNDITSFSDSLRIKKHPRFYRWIIKSPGTHAIYLHQDGHETIRISYHEDESVRCDLWEGNVSIANADKWNGWLYSHSDKTAKK